MNRRPLAIFTTVLLVTLAVTTVRSQFFVTDVVIETFVEENISVSPSTVELFLSPGESATVLVTLANTSPVSSNVDLALSVTPSGLEVSAPESVIVPFEDSVVVSVQVQAKNDAVPGTYVITLGISRSGG